MNISIYNVFTVPVDIDFKHLTFCLSLNISAEEVLEAVKSLKCGKAAGIDEIRPEMLKAMGPVGMHWLWRMCQRAWLSGDTPEDWRTGVVVPLYKKGDHKDCGNYRGITLLSLPGKVYAKILEKRCRPIVESRLHDEQCGFRAGRSTTDQIFTLHQLLEKSWEYGKEVYLCFVDLEKAYDRVPRIKLWRCLQEYGINGQLLKAIQSLYSDCKSCVRIGGKTSKKFNVSCGLRQGCVLSPLLFILYMDWIVEKCDIIDGVGIGHERISHLLFADDLVFLAESEESLQRMLERFGVECSDACMRVSTSKSEGMVVARREAQCRLNVDGVALKQVEKFKYLGSTFASDGKWDTEINIRIGKAGAVMRELYRTIVAKRELSIRAKLAVFKAIYVPTLIYGHESWVMTERMRSQVQAAEMRFLRRVAGVRRIDRVRNSAIREELQIEPLLLKIERSQLRWFGHVLRMPTNRLPIRVYSAQPTGRRPRGRPRKTWRASMEGLCERLGLSPASVQAVAGDRDQRRARIACLTSRPERTKDLAD